VEIGGVQDAPERSAYPRGKRTCLLRALARDEVPAVLTTVLRIRGVETGWIQPADICEQAGPGRGAELRADRGGPGPAQRRHLWTALEDPGLQCDVR
jgi:hypothetical protein